MTTLKNVNHKFDVGLGDVGCTIRKGIHWASTPIGEHLCLSNCSTPHSDRCHAGCYFEGFGQIIGRWVGRLDKLPPTLLSIEHNHRARDMKVLKDMLRDGYGSIDDSNVVTAVIYIRTEVHP